MLFLVAALVTLHRLILITHFFLMHVCAIIVVAIHFLFARSFVYYMLLLILFQVDCLEVRNGLFLHSALMMHLLIVINDRLLHSFILLAVVWFFVLQLRGPFLLYLEML